MKKALYFIVPLFIASILWELISRSSFVSPFLFPPPSKVLLALFKMIGSGVLIYDIKDSAWRLVLGLLLGSAFGIAVGLITGKTKRIRSICVPFIQILRSLPPVAIIPLVIVWFGIGDGAKIFSIAFAVFFPVWINVYIGVGEIPQTFLWSAQLLTKSQVKTFYKVILPATLPFIISGIRTGISIGFIMVFVSELAGASSGLGYRISITQLSYRIDEMMAALIVLGILGALTDYLFLIFVRKLLPWINLNSK